MSMVPTWLLDLSRNVIEATIMTSMRGTPCGGEVLEGWWGESQTGTTKKKQQGRKEGTAPLARAAYEKEQQWEGRQDTHRWIDVKGRDAQATLCVRFANRGKKKDDVPSACEKGNHAQSSKSVNELQFVVYK